MWLEVAPNLTGQEQYGSTEDWVISGGAHVLGEWFNNAKRGWEFVQEDDLITGLIYGEGEESQGTI